MDLVNLQTDIVFWLVLAWLLPLAAFILELLIGSRFGKYAAVCAIGGIGGSFLCSLMACFLWLQTSVTSESPPESIATHSITEGIASTPDQMPAVNHSGDVYRFATFEEHHSENDVSSHHEAHDSAGHDSGSEHHEAPELLGMAGFERPLYSFATFGESSLGLSVYVDGLTIAMFVMVSFIATLIHVYAVGYMHDELHEFTDPEVVLSDGNPLTRPGRFPRFFTYFSLFTFSMLGLVIAGNIFQVFIFWELVGLCSYLLIGFYFERKTASTAANKAFIVNRVGDFGFLIGLMILWTSFSSFEFTEIFGQLRGPLDTETHRWGEMHYDQEVHGLILQNTETGTAQMDPETQNPRTVSYYLLVAAGLGIFCGCVGKSAQFPLHTWLPDAMEGPTPVSGLVHSATMVAAGVYLVGRFYPVFTPEVLLVIAYIGGITLMMAATIAIVATDIKRVLAYSTISQLGYMMLALGIGGWVAGLFHLLTHAFFKALLFLCSGSVIHATHTNEMPRMGGLRKKMPATFWTMFAGVIAISGLAIPGVLGFAGFYSKDEILANALAFGKVNPQHMILFWLPMIGAAITSFYMFRLLFMTFFGKPRDQHGYDHAHESPPVMWVPLAILAFFSTGAFICWVNPTASAGLDGKVPQILHDALPFVHSNTTVGLSGIQFASSDAVHAVHAQAGTLALIMAVGGAVFAYLFYGAGILNPSELQRQFSPIHRFLQNSWYFDELYDWLFVHPTHRVARWFSGLDRNGIDWLIDHSASFTVMVSRLNGAFDYKIVDGTVNLVAKLVYRLADWLRVIQTGQLRQYVLFIVVSTIGLFMAIIFIASK